MQFVALLKFYKMCAFLHRSELTREVLKYWCRISDDVKIVFPFSFIFSFLVCSLWNSSKICKSICKCQFCQILKSQLDYIVGVKEFCRLQRCFQKSMPVQPRVSQMLITNLAKCDGLSLVPALALGDAASSAVFSFTRSSMAETFVRILTLSVCFALRYGYGYRHVEARATTHYHVVVLPAEVFRCFCFDYAMTVAIK